MTLDPEVARRVKNLTLKARRTVEGLLSGIHRSPHRGASVVFVEHREYRPGDDPRLLDWRAFARTDRDVVKRFEQETQLRATLVLDRSGSMSFRGADAPPDTPSKAEHGATLLGALAYVLISQGDAAGAATFTDDLSVLVPPRTRPAHLDTVLALLSEPPTADAPTDLGSALTALAERTGRRGVVAIASDLVDLDENALAPIAHLVTRGHDVIVLHILSPDEVDFPYHGPLRFVGCEGEASLDADADTVRGAYQREMARFLASCRERCVAAGARYALARTDQRPEHTLGAILTGGRRRGF